MGLLLWEKNAFAQNENVSTNSVLYYDHQLAIDNFYIRNPSEKFHSSFQPFLFFSQRNYKNSIAEPFFPEERKTLATIKSLGKDSTISTTEIIPLAELQAGYDAFRKQTVLEKGGGVFFRQKIGNRLTASARLTGGEISLPTFSDTLVSTLGIIPGNGIAYGRNNNYQWANLSGYISYTSKQYFNFQIGKDKHFIGDGYRSLLLSDVANNYPYFRSSINIWNIQYACWYSWMYDISQSNGIKSKFLNKFGTFHYLSWNISKTVNLSFFENIIWQGTDTNRVRNFDVNYLNPVIFFRPVEYSLGSSDNAFVGINFSWKIAKTLKFYLQAAADEFYVKEIRKRSGWWANKQGIQAGLKYINAFTIKNLSLQGEFNMVRPYTYSHGSPQQSYAHFNQPLAHPFGANFYEGVGIINYRKGKWRAQLKGMYAIIGKDSAASEVSMGQNVLLSYMNRPKLSNGNPQDYHHFIGQGVKTEILQLDASVHYYLIPKINLRTEAGIIFTHLINANGFNHQYPFIYFGIRSSMQNIYRDIF
jgi:hypothetical protein